MRQRDLGFSFIELMVTLAIMAVLGLIALPVGEIAAQRKKEAELRAALSEIRSALDAYKKASEQGRTLVKAGESGYPKSLELLVEGLPDLRSPERKKMFFLRRVPRDPMFANASVAAADTWGKRSYASPPDDPREGDDIFDVYSLANARGLNGVPYRQW